MHEKKNDSTCMYSNAMSACTAHDDDGDECVCQKLRETA